MSELLAITEIKEIDCLTYFLIRIVVYIDKARSYKS